MMKPVLLAIFLWLTFYPLAAQQGCTDPQATNYNPNATHNNGSCSYATTNYTLPQGVLLNTNLNENSGLAYVNGDLWTFNDGGNAASLYKINPATGQILRTVPVTNATNVDWEDITADDQYLYIGDFGNNANGNRQDLKIYKITLTDLYNDPVLGVNAEVINFAYSDQTDFTPKGENRTEFDCEAFFVRNNQLHLFSKDWIGPLYQTKHYIVPTAPGSYVATLEETFNVNGAITGADIARDNTNEIVLIGYHPNPFDSKLFMWLLFDYHDDSFFSGNKRRIELGFAFVKGQIEGVTYIGEGIGYMASERVDILNLPANLYTFTSVNWVPLPVNLLNFNVTYTSPDIQISWQTATETESGYFALERSVDAILFEEIHRQAAAGTSNSIQSYRYTDRKEGSHTYYYRLKMVDKNGKFTYSSIQTIDVTDKRILQINPVPARRGEYLEVTYSPGNTPSPIQISLWDTKGYTWLQGNYLSYPASGIKLDTTHLPPGIYILQVADTQEVITQKILIL
ncbi:T9SS type A sorting domain-containing protein [Rhodocytophaga aerolata]|uniref:T9SS type A sorting domain-containing protein n=1 Tax=Rhodocytophaga aerolata TaxID=455078 RepID=A0ABT8R7P5_9BACT|nr:T9SS type A sorting domain-containing protein [Rhodocytophaga aerolata]MDO1448126.1 T9SS type A sorting domain-containing protein [Rhodocytophaga aerolata]